MWVWISRLCSRFRITAKRTKQVQCTWYMAVTIAESFSSPTDWPTDWLTDSSLSDRNYFGNVKVGPALFPVGENLPVGKTLQFPGAILRLRTGKFPYMSPYPPPIRTLSVDQENFAKKQARKLGRCNSYLPNLKIWPTDPPTGVGARRC